MSATRKIRDLAQVIRSKNSGPFELTLDIIFEDNSTYQKVRDSRVITKELVGRLYQIPTEKVLHLVPFDSARAIKITIVRPIVSGNIGETDAQGGQQHAPLLDIEIPWE